MSAKTKEDNNGDYHYRFDLIERDLISLKTDLKEPMSRLVTAIDNNSAAIAKHAETTNAMAAKIDSISAHHLKIIYWLLIIVGSAFVGAKGVELFHNVMK